MNDQDKKTEAEWTSKRNLEAHYRKRVEDQRGCFESTNMLASEISKKLKYTVTQVNSVRLFEYQLSFSVKPTPDIENE